MITVVEHWKKLIKSNMFNDNIICVTCTTFSSGIIDSNGIIYTFGDNGDCELGIGDKSKELINILSINEKCQYIIGGSYHIGVITNDNNCYMFGDNAHGECGFKMETIGSNYSERNIGKPTKLNMFKGNVYKIKCGRHHTIINTNNNMYYVFGDNTDGQCLVDTDLKNIDKPTPISMEYLEKKINCKNKIIDIVPGCSMSFILVTL